MHFHSFITVLFLFNYLQEWKVSILTEPFKQRDNNSHERKHERKIEFRVQIKTLQSVDTKNMSWIRQSNWGTENMHRTKNQCTQ